LFQSLFKPRFEVADREPIATLRHSGQAQREPESRLDSRPGLLFAGVTFFRGNDEAKQHPMAPLRPMWPEVF